MIKVVGLGAGGHAKVVIDIIRRAGGAEIVGLLDANADLWGSEVCGVRVLGGDELLPQLLQRGIDTVFIGVGSAGATTVRSALFRAARVHGLEVISAIDPQAIVSSFAKIGSGATIMPAAIINAGAVLDENVIINTGAIVEHDCVIERNVHIATGARLAGSVRVGSGAHVGLGASVRQHVRIGERAVVGAGAVVVRDVPDNVLVVGVPAHVVREITVE